MSVRRLVLRFLILSPFLLGLACNFPLFARPGSPVPPGLPPLPGDPTPASTVPYQPIFELADCAFPVPQGEDPQCGYLVVPERRDVPGSRSIRLHTAIFRSRSAAPAGDPVIYLAGGPGSSALELAGYLFQQGMDVVLERRDFIFFDQRGTGYSQPRLDCPERFELAPVLLGGALSSGDADLAIVDAFRRCKQRLAEEGNDLSAYTSAASAADLNDLRIALGYEQVNLYGVSYGSRLALTAMRDFPGMVRSAVLDSVYPLQINLYTALAPNAERAFQALFDRCAGNPGCSRDYPDLRSRFFALVDQLNASPVYVEVSVRGEIFPVRLDGRLLIDVLFVGLYNPSVTARMPRMIAEIQQGNYTILQERLRLYFTDTTALGMQMAVQCSEEIPFSQPEEVFAAAQGISIQIAGFFPANVQPLFTACQDWRTTELNPLENQPVSSAVPTLILAGELDPITPPDWGLMVSTDLTNSYFYILPSNGHWVTRSSACARQMAFTFWENPAAAPDSSCLSTVPNLDFQ